ncbi:MAG: glycosyltransferase family 4 protein [bacterium]
MPTGALLAHPGTQYSFHLARELLRHGNLSAFYTSVAINGESSLARQFSPLVRILGKQKEWQNRLFYGVPAGKVHSYPGLEACAFLRTRRGEPGLSVLRGRNERFQRRIPDGALAAAQAVIGFDTSSHILAARARALGRNFILDRSIGYERSVNGLFEHLHDRFPEWPDTWAKKSEADLEIEEREHQLAHLIVVPSRFVAQTLIATGVPSSKIRINPFGTDLQRFNVAPDSQVRGPLIFLFVGALTARKGLPLLLQAWSKLNPPDAELWIGGSGDVPDEVCRRCPDSIHWLGPLTREHLPSVFQQAHVFVLPSYFEGLAQVQVEALACGTPVIGTRASGAEEVVEEGQTGFLIEPGNLDQLVESLQQFITRPALAREMREQVKAKRSGLGWSAYGDRWNRILQELN